MRRSLLAYSNFADYLATVTHLYSTMPLMHFNMRFFGIPNEEKCIFYSSLFFSLLYLLEVRNIRFGRNMFRLHYAIIASKYVCRNILLRVGIFHGYSHTHTCVTCMHAHMNRVTRL